MTKSVGAALLAHLRSEVTTLATIWTVTRADGTVFRFTDHDDDIVYSGSRYRARVGYDASNTDSAAGFQVSNLDVTGIMSDESITEVDLKAGLWDFARIEIAVVNYTDPSHGKMVLRSGTLGQVTLERGSFKVELRGLAQAYEQGLSKVYSQLCRARFGDADCQFPANYFVFDATVIQVISRREFRVYCVPGLVPNVVIAGDRIFRYGRCTGLTGNNAGFVMEIKDDREESGFERHITLQLPFTYDISLGDTFTLALGCDKTIETCHRRFSNSVNFRGEPYVPLVDAVTAGSKGNTQADLPASGVIGGSSLGGGLSSGSTGTGGGGSAGGGVIVDGVDTSLAGSGSDPGNVGGGVTGTGGGAGPGGSVGSGTTGGGTGGTPGTNYVPYTQWTTPDSTAVAFSTATLQIRAGRPGAAYTVIGRDGHSCVNASGILDVDGNADVTISLNFPPSDYYYAYFMGGGAPAGVVMDVTIGGDWTVPMGLYVSAP